MFFISSLVRNHHKTVFLRKSHILMFCYWQNHGNSWFTLFWITSTQNENPSLLNQDLVIQYYLYTCHPRYHHRKWILKPQNHLILESPVIRLDRYLLIQLLCSLPSQRHQISMHNQQIPEVIPWQSNYYLNSKSNCCLFAQPMYQELLISIFQSRVITIETVDNPWYLLAIVYSFHFWEYVILTLLKKLIFFLK